MGDQRLTASKVKSRIVKVHKTNFEDRDQRLTASKVKSQSITKRVRGIIHVINALRHLRLNHFRDSFVDKFIKQVINALRHLRLNHYRCPMRYCPR